ncbi:MAG: redoxin domain-containing protein [Gemmatimonadetes bacterium]|nr:redoxin domain-containing protein [Gemmatimonadota bacterium]
MRTITLGAALSLLAVTTSLTGQQRPTFGPKDGPTARPADLDRVKVGSPAPEFTLEALDGPAITLSDYRGKKDVILVFYRGWW